MSGCSECIIWNYYIFLTNKIKDYVNLYYLNKNVNENILINKKGNSNISVLPSGGGDILYHSELFVDYLNQIEEFESYKPIENDYIPLSIDWKSHIYFCFNYLNCNHKHYINISNTIIKGFYEPTIDENIFEQDSNIFDCLVEKLESYSGGING